jgi:hypothetical protein
MTNSVGSRYIGTIGTSGRLAGEMHSHSGISLMKSINRQSGFEQEQMKQSKFCNFLREFDVKAMFRQSSNVVCPL